MSDSDIRPKRSRFDQTTPARPSRFDQRSRSPPLNRDKPTRERDSRGPSSEPGSAKAPASDPAAAAAAAAARINAQIQSRRPDAASAASPSAAGSASPPPAVVGAKLNGEIYVADGDYKKDVEVNDSKNRYMLTKGSTQQMIKDETGADVTTRGSYLPDKNLATPTNPPLHLHVTSTSKEGLEQAVAKIDELMKQELPNLVDERRFRRREPVEHVERDEYGRRKWPEERVPINLEPIPGFNLRAQVVGQGGAYVKHIQQETRCRVQIKGQGSGFTDRATGHEHDEPMFLHVVGPDANDVQHAKELCEDLLANVHEQYERFKENPPPPPRPYGGGGGGGPHGGGHHPYGNYRNYSHGYYDGYGGGTPTGPGGYHQQRNNHYYRPPQQSPPSAIQSPHTPTPSFSPAPQPQSAMAATTAATATTPTPTSATDYAAQYAQYYGTSGDPYAAYGGYQNYVAYYQYYQQAMQAQQQQQQSAPAQAPATSATPSAPVAAAGTGASPPPPAPPDTTSAYNSPPPPPPPAPGV